MRCPGTATLSGAHRNPSPGQEYRGRPGSLGIREGRHAFHTTGFALAAAVSMTDARIARAGWGPVGSSAFPEREPPGER
jgi:hypothetical protein